MLPTDLALRLRAAGLTWKPGSGDRFFLPHRDMDDEVFVISEMTVDVYRFPHQTVIGFNGVTEWALDSVAQDEAVWLPSEEQLRDLLGERFDHLDRLPDGGFEVTLAPGGTDARTARHPVAAGAYALALLQLWGDG